MRNKPAEPDNRALRGDTPEPGWRSGARRLAMSGLLRRGAEDRWGAQLLRIASDMMVVCSEELEILHHNRAFLKAVGYGEGSFRGMSLLDFFPSEEREGILAVFRDWRRGHAAGMRFQGPLLTTKGERPVDFRAVRSRERAGTFVYYLVAREAPPNVRGPSAPEEEGREAFFRGLPVAAWRTDAALRIVQAYGSLWPELGAASEDLVGEVFERHQHSLLPEVLRDIDCSDVLSGMSVQSEIRHEDAPYQVSVEPFLDAGGKLVGTVGLIRRAAAQSPTASSGDGPVAVRHHTPPAGLLRPGAAAAT